MHPLFIDALTPAAGDAALEAQAAPLAFSRRATWPGPHAGELSLGARFGTKAENIGKEGGRASVSSAILALPLQISKTRMSKRLRLYVMS